MNETVLTGQGTQITEIPRADWEQALSDIPRHFEARLGFMSQEHHLVRNFVVREIPITAKALSPLYIAQKLDLSLERTEAILEELEKNLTFLYRNDQGAVTWGYPVTVEKTPHHITFSTGEHIYAA